MQKPGLTGLTDKDLERLLKALHSGLMPCPITAKSLGLAGLSYLQDKIGFLQQLPEPAVRAALVAVLHERRK